MKTLVITLIIVCNALTLIGATVCECGSHSAGIYSYRVNGSSCCGVAALAEAHFIEYENQGGDVWVVTSINSISGGVAQGFCCGLA